MGGWYYIRGVDRLESSTRNWRGSLTSSAIALLFAAGISRIVHGQNTAKHRGAAETGEATPEHAERCRTSCDHVDAARRGRGNERRFGVACDRRTIDNDMIKPALQFLDELR